MRRFCWRERSEKLNWRLLSALDVADVVRRGDPAALEPYALHVTFARLPRGAGEALDPATRDAWFLVRLLQLAMEYLLFMRARDGDVLEALGQELRQLEQERDELVLGAQRWKARARSGDKQVDKLHQVLQNIAKLLQIHGASPSAVATIETLLTELIAERRAKQKRRTLVENEDGEEAVERVLRPAVQEARVCGFCGKLFSSAEYLENHLVRRHGGERIEVETPVKNKMRQDFRDGMEDKENRARNEDSSEAAMQKMVQQVERALREHEEKMRLLAEEEAQKVQQVYKQLHTETKLAEELKDTRLKTEQQHEEAQRRLDEVCLHKQKAEDDLADLKQRIQFLTLKNKMMGSAGLPARLPHSDDEALAAAKAEISKLQETLEVVSTELTSSREELAKVHSLYLSALRKKKELADKLALPREVPAVVQQDSSSQTDQPTMVTESAQTEEQNIPLLVQSEMLTESSVPICADVGTDPLVLIYEAVGIQTVDHLEPSFVDAAIIEEVSVKKPTASPATSEPNSQAAPTEASDVIEAIVTVQKDNEHIPDYIQKIHSQDLIDTLLERAQSSANKLASFEAPLGPASNQFSSIPRHKYVRSQFQHDEQVVKERVASCLAQLEQFSSRFGVPAKSAWLSEDNLQIVQQALHGHLEVLPTEVLAKMIECENAANMIIEKEWVPMEMTRQQALERFKMEARAKSEISQGLVRQAMAAFGSSVKADQPSGASNGEVVMSEKNTEASGSAEKTIAESEPNELKPVDVPADNKNDHELPVVTSARRYSAKNQLTVVVDGESTTEGTAYLPDEFVEHKSSACGSVAVAATKAEENVSPPEVRDAVDYLVESLHHDDQALNLKGKTEEPTTQGYTANSLQPRFDSGEAVAGSASSVVAELPAVTETRLPSESVTSQIKSIRVDSVTEDRRRPSWEIVDRSRSDFAEPNLNSIEGQSVQEDTSDRRQTEKLDEDEVKRSQWNLPRVGSFSDLRSPQRISVHPVLSRTRSDHFEAVGSPQRTDSLESDRLSAGSQFEILEPLTRLDRTQSIVASSEMSFDTNIPSLEETSESVEASTSAVVMGLVDAVDTMDDNDDSGSERGRAPAPAVFDKDRDVQNDSVMSFDDSDIEEVVLT